MHQELESISFLVAKLWNILPARLKNVNSIEAFKMQIKKRKPANFPCRLWKVYGFMFKMLVLFKRISIEEENEKFHVKYELDK